MKKQELLHVHTLLAEVGNYCQDRGVALGLSEYHAQGTYPMAISQSKGDHEAAVLALAGGLASSLEREAAGDHDGVVSTSAD